jgi:hypothetical protein
MKKRFSFLSDAKTFLNKKRRDGFKAKIVHHLGIGSPYREVIYSKNKTGTTMTKKKKKVRKGNFIARLQRTPKVRAIKAKIRKHKAVAKRLSSEYRRTLKSAAKKLK